MSKKNTIISFIIIILVAVGVGAYFYFNSQYKPAYRIETQQITCANGSSHRINYYEISPEEYCARIIKDNTYNTISNFSDINANPEKYVHSEQGEQTTVLLGTLTSQSKQLLLFDENNNSVPVKEWAPYHAGKPASKDKEMPRTQYDYLDKKVLLKGWFIYSESGEHLFNVSESYIYGEDIETL